MNKYLILALITLAGILSWVGLLYVVINSSLNLDLKGFFAMFGGLIILCFCGMAKDKYVKPRRRHATLRVNR